MVDDATKADRIVETSAFAKEKDSSRIVLSEQEEKRLQRLILQNEMVDQEKREGPKKQDLEVETSARCCGLFPAS